jgi:ribosomal protein L10
MSKYVKDLITSDLKGRLDGVQDALVVNVNGMTANANFMLRRELRKQKMSLLVVKNSLARRATDGTALAGLMAQIDGPAAIVWGGSDIVSLAKEVTRLAQEKQMAPFAPRGGMMDGSPLSPGQVAEVSKWPSREEQLSIVVGQILGPGAKLASQLNSVGGALASQIKQKGEEEEGAEASEAPSA